MTELRHGGGPGRLAALERRRWILLMPNIPTSPTTARVRIWRRLQSVGAITLKNSVYVLPNVDECVETFQWIGREIVALGGQASLCEGQFVDDATDLEIERRFVDARGADYAALAEDARAAAKRLRAKRMSPQKLEAVASEHKRLKARLDEIVAIDFCHAPRREAAEGIIGAMGADLAERSGGAGAPGSLEAMPHPRSATWVTRSGVHVDRIASAWLIRRFIDPDATLKFVPGKGYASQPGELRFDMYDAEFTHVGDRCTFEVLLERMGLQDAALAALAEIVHDIDLRDEKFGREETAGVRSAIVGVCRSEREDLARITAAAPLFEALYAFFALERTSSTHPQSSRKSTTQRIRTLTSRPARRAGEKRYERTARKAASSRP